MYRAVVLLLSFIGVAHLYYIILFGSLVPIWYAVEVSDTTMLSIDNMLITK